LRFSASPRVWVAISSPVNFNDSAGQEGLEPPTTGFGDRDSGQLSYCPLHGLEQNHRRNTPLGHAAATTKNAVGPCSVRPPIPVRLTGHVDGTLGFMSTRVSARIAAIAESATLAVDAKAKALKAAGRRLRRGRARFPDARLHRRGGAESVRGAEVPQVHAGGRAARAARGHRG